MPCMDNVAATPLEALWASLTAFLGFMAGAVAAHPVAAAVGALYVGTVFWIGYAVGSPSRKEQEAGTDHEEQEEQEVSPHV